MKNIIFITFLLSSLFAQYEIEDRWHLVGYEDNIMYQFENNYRYSIYSTDGNFGGLEDAGNSPNPYTVEEDIITIDLFFGNIVSYQMNYRCDGQVVDFIYTPDEIIHSTLFREGYDFIDNECEEILEECFDFTGIDFGVCAMVLGVGLLNDECSYISGCDWTADGIDYSELFFESIEECQEICSNNLTVTDIDGNVYETVILGEQLWMAENLKTTHYQNGDDIPHVIDTSDWDALSTGAYCEYENNPINSDIYGRLYNWYTIDDSRGVCPEGFHVPSDDEIKQLEMFLGMSQQEANGVSFRGTDEGSQLAGRADLWNDGDLENNPAFDSAGFVAIPGGARIGGNINFIDMGIWGDYWSSTTQDWGAWVRNFAYYNSASHRQICDKHYGMAIRCVSDNYILGDINGDEVLNVLDIVLMINMILSDEYSVVADVNEDGSVDVLDVVLMVNILVGGLPQSN